MGGLLVSFYLIIKINQIFPFLSVGYHPLLRTPQTALVLLEAVSPASAALIVLALLHFLAHLACVLLKLH